MIALPPALRPSYVAQIRALATGPVLTIELEYADGAYQGPPFSVSDAEVRGYSSRLG